MCYEITLSMEHYLTANNRSLKAVSVLGSREAIEQKTLKIKYQAEN